VDRLNPATPREGRERRGAARRDRHRRFETADATRLAEPDAISICVPTPLSKFKDPDVSYIVAATEAVKRTLRRGQAIILESTTYPGTTREILLPALESTGLKVGEDFFLAFSPERVDPGNPVWQTHNTPKVVGGITEDCRKVACALYQPAIERLVPVSTTEAAELVKLLENTFRSVNIGLVNEMAIVCDKLGVDVWEVIEAAATKPFGFAKFLRSRAGRHCIPIDPHYLAWKMGLNYKTRFIDPAAGSTPKCRCSGCQGRRGAERAGPRGAGASVLVLGVAYKRDIDDIARRRSTSCGCWRGRAPGSRITTTCPASPRTGTNTGRWPSRRRRCAPPTA
jgi:UDP-N-acetyl-D-glucosamine dehydrogenase